MTRAQDDSEQGARAPLTTAETSGWTRTSTLADVQRFLGELEALPHADRLEREVFGRSEEGRELVLLRAVHPRFASEAELLRSGRVRVLVNANIHAGEVEGKEAVQMILREIAQGEHAALLERLAIFFVPVYNADGNERIDPRNRADQNGPEGGVGTRENARGLDLNRDFVKAECAETRALLGLWRRLDPHVFMDLHTTNGSYHGYHLTYSPSLSTNVSPSLDAFTRQEFLPAVRAAMLERHGWRVFDYGNFPGEGERRWETYDHRPRFGTNCFGLRNRISVLSEAYSHLSFEERVRVTRDYVLEVLAAAAKSARRIWMLCGAADAELVAGQPAARFGWESALVPPVEGEILVGGVERVELEGGLGTRLVALPTYEAVRMPVQVAFRSRAGTPLPFAWALLDPPAGAVEALELHGIELRRLERAAPLEVERFEPSEKERAERAFQGHHEIALAGEWTRSVETLPAGTLVVPARQRLARLAAQLLEPESEDSLSTWGFLESVTRAREGEQPGNYPVLRIPSPTERW